MAPGPQFLCGTTVLLAGLFCVGSAEIDDETARAEFDLLDETATLRRDRDLPPLKHDFAIGLVARDYSRAMARAHRVVHGLREPLADRVRNVAPDNCVFGENLARVVEVDDVLPGWIASEPHRHNLLLADFDRNGFGVVRGDDGFLYVTQLLAGSCRSVSSR